MTKYLRYFSVNRESRLRLVKLEEDSTYAFERVSVASVAAAAQNVTASCVRPAGITESYSKRSDELLLHIPNG